jgi:hypothetical protein
VGWDEKELKGGVTDSRKRTVEGGEEGGDGDLDGVLGPGDQQHRLECPQHRGHVPHAPACHKED